MPIPEPVPTSCQRLVEVEQCKPVLDAKELASITNLVEKIYIKDEVIEYIAKIIDITRHSHHVYLGASPRASINLALAAKAYAFINRRGFVTPEDVRAICPDVMQHRIGITYEAEAEDITQADIVTKIMEQIQVP